MRSLLAGSFIVMGAFTSGCAGADADSTDTENGEAAIVGGRAEVRWAASGYLASGSSMETLDRGRPACGATLIAPNVVVTAAHCISDEKVTFAFGAGEVGKGALVRVVERHVHPEFHPVAEGAFDVTHALRNFDVAFLVLERDVDFASPAELPDEAPALGCNLQAIGYHGSGGQQTRVSTPACVVLKVTLGTDPIFEVHPEGKSGLCIADGDEGSAVVAREASRTKLVGIFVGSVTQGLTDCVGGTQFLNGYESAFGYREFLREGIAKARRR
jgi:hypothetical protein